MEIVLNVELFRLARKIFNHAQDASGLPEGEPSLTFALKRYSAFMTVLSGSVIYDN
jgi:hypothetical protein